VSDFLKLIDQYGKSILLFLEQAVRVLTGSLVINKAGLDATIADNPRSVVGCSLLFVISAGIVASVGTLKSDEPLPGVLLSSFVISRVLLVFAGAILLSALASFIAWRRWPKVFVEVLVALAIATLIQAVAERTRIVISEIIQTERNASDFVSDAEDAEPPDYDRAMRGEVTLATLADCLRERNYPELQTLRQFCEDAEELGFAERFQRTCDDVIRVMPGIPEEESRNAPDLTSAQTSSSSEPNREPIRVKRLPGVEERELAARGLDAFYELIQQLLSWLPLAVFGVAIFRLPSQKPRRHLLSMLVLAGAYLAATQTPTFTKERAQQESLHQTLDKYVAINRELYENGLNSTAVLRSRAQDAVCAKILQDWPASPLGASEAPEQAAPAAPPPPN
jgi:hypothetical protein